MFLFNKSPFCFISATPTCPPSNIDNFIIMSLLNRRLLLSSILCHCKLLNKKLLEPHTLATCVTFLLRCQCGTKIKGGKPMFSHPEIALPLTSPEPHGENEPERAIHGGVINIYKWCTITWGCDNVGFDSWEYSDSVNCTNLGTPVSISFWLIHCL